MTARGDVPAAAKQLAADEVGRLDRYVKGPVTAARVVLIQEENPRIACPARAEGEVLVAGRPVRARTAAPSMQAAVDDLAERLGRQMRRHVERIVTDYRQPAESSNGRWRHGSLPTARPERSFRSPEERRLERRKSFALEPMDPAEAALEMETLDHDFFLFTEADNGVDAVVYRRDDGRLGLIEPADADGGPHDLPAREASRFSEPIDLATAVAEMDALDHRFLYFVNSESGRGNVIYLRHDGHYGLIEPAV